MQFKHDVIVIGIGAMGASTCFHLAKLGLRVLGLEQFDIPHAHGSSHGYSRMIRKAYFEHPNYVPLLHLAYELWDELEALSHRRLLHRVGGIFMGPRGNTLVSGALAAAKLHHLPHELLSADELRHRWPQFVIPDSWSAFFEPDSGFLLPERVITTYAEFAMRQGAEIHAQEPVRRWKPEGNHYVISTDHATYHAESLIFCGGAWTGKLLKNLGVPLKVTRQVAAWVWPKKPESFDLGRIPVWGFDDMNGGLYYGFPMIEDSPGFKLAHHLPTVAAVDPDSVSREIEPTDREDIRRILTTYLPTADGPLLALKTCLYTNSPDGHFLVDHLPEYPRVQIACGFSGHGFKFASAIGSALADATLSGKLDPSMDFLSLARFAKSS